MEMIYANRNKDEDGVIEYDVGSFNETQHVLFQEGAGVLLASDNIDTLIQHKEILEMANSVGDVFVIIEVPLI